MCTWRDTNDQVVVYIYIAKRIIVEVTEYQDISCRSPQLPFSLFDGVTEKKKGPGSGALAFFSGRRSVVACSRLPFSSQQRVNQRLSHLHNIPTKNLKTSCNPVGRQFFVRYLLLISRVSTCIWSGVSHQCDDHWVVVELHNLVQVVHCHNARILSQSQLWGLEKEPCTFECAAFSFHLQITEKYLVVYHSKSCWNGVRGDVGRSVGWYAYGRKVQSLTHDQSRSPFT